jgi:AraC-like DNA-binding protein
MYYFHLMVNPNSPRFIRLFLKNYGLKMKLDIPLAKFPILATNCIEKAEVGLSRSLTTARISRINDRKRFELRMNGVNIGSTSLVYTLFGAGTKLNSVDEDHVHFVMGSSIPSTFSLYRKSVVASPQNAAMLVSPKQFQIERPEGSEVLALRTSQSNLLYHFEELTGRHHRGSLIFDHTIDLANGPGAMLKRTMNYLVYELEHNDKILKNHGISKSYEHMLLTALLSLPNNKREYLYEDRRHQVAPGIVRRAEEYMRSHLKDAISIIDLLRICDCSRNVLFSAFSNARNYTPMEFLTEQRLQSARDKLLKPRGESSVSSIAIDCGFTHLGRFSQVYKKRFGENPSETLHKGR